MAICEAIRSIYMQDNQLSGFTWGSIPSTYESLRIVGSWCADAHPDTAYAAMYLRMGNGSASSSGIYGLQEIINTYNTKATFDDKGRSAGGMLRGMTGLGGFTVFTSFIIDIYGYKDADTLTSVNMIYGGSGQRSEAANEDTHLVVSSGLYNSNAVIDTIHLTSTSTSCLAGCEAHLYGFKSS